MLVLKTTSPSVCPGAPADTPWNQVPSSSARIAFIPSPVRLTRRRRARARRQPPARVVAKFRYPGNVITMRYSPGAKSFIVSGVVPLGLPLIVTAAPVGPRINRQHAAGRRCRRRLADRRRRARPRAARWRLAAVVSRTSSVRDGRAVVIVHAARSREDSRGAQSSTLRVPTSRSRRASGVTPLATPSTATLAPLGVDLTSRRPTFADALAAPAAAVAGGAAATRVPLVPLRPLVLAESAGAGSALTATGPG